MKSPTRSPLLLGALASLAGGLLGLGISEGTEKFRNWNADRELIRHSSVYQARGFSVDSGPEWTGKHGDASEVTVLKHRDTGRRYVVVRAGGAVAISELRDFVK